MTEEYKKRLLELTTEIQELTEDIDPRCGIERAFITKLNFLLGYIMALEDKDK